MQNKLLRKVFQEARSKSPLTRIQRTSQISYYNKDSHRHTNNRARAEALVHKLLFLQNRRFIVALTQIYKYGQLLRSNHDKLSCASQRLLKAHALQKWLRAVKIKLEKKKQRVQTHSASPRKLAHSKSPLTIRHRAQQLHLQLHTQLNHQVTNRQIELLMKALRRYQPALLRICFAKLKALPKKTPKPKSNALPGFQKNLDKKQYVLAKLFRSLHKLLCKRVFIKLKHKG